jgi:hypothetical protein
MPSSSRPATLVVYVLLIPLGVAVVLAGVVGALTVREIWWEFVLFAVGGVVVLYGAVRGIAGWSKAAKVAETTRSTMVEAAREPAVASGEMTGPVLAHWTYRPAEWRAYVAAEMHHRVREALTLGAIPAVLGTLILRILKPDWALALWVGVGLGVFVAVWRLAMALAAHRRHLAVAHGEVIIGPTALLVNGRYETIDDGSIRFAGARVLEDGRPAILEIAIRVPGKYRGSAEEYRIPIPAGRGDEARAVARALQDVHASSRADLLPAG